MHTGIFTHIYTQVFDMNAQSLVAIHACKLPLRLLSGDPRAGFNYYNNMEALVTVANATNMTSTCTYTYIN